jgi:hypothetical protein
MLISTTLAQLKYYEIVGRDRIRIGDLLFRVTAWDAPNKRLMLEPVIGATPTGGLAQPDGSATD